MLLRVTAKIGQKYMLFCNWHGTYLTRSFRECYKQVIKQLCIFKKLSLAVYAGKFDVKLYMIEMKCINIRLKYIFGAKYISILKNNRKITLFIISIKTLLYLFNLKFTIVVIMF